MARSTRRSHDPATKAELRHLRALLRDRSARDVEGVFVCEGTRVIEVALQRGIRFVACYVGHDASADARVLADRMHAAGIPLRELDASVGDTVSPQSIVALVPLRREREVPVVDLAIVGASIADPGNAGTLIRSAAAAGAQAIFFGSGSVDAYNPKVVRASAGACFAIRIVEGVAAMEILETLGAAGVQCLGAVVAGGVAPDACDLVVPTAFVVGHEVHGLDSALPLEARVTLPMQQGESLNVAMAGTVLLFEAERQRRGA